MAKTQVIQGFAIGAVRLDSEAWTPARSVARQRARSAGDARFEVGEDPPSALGGLLPMALEVISEASPALRVVVFATDRDEEISPTDRDRALEALRALSRRPGVFVWTQPSPQDKSVAGV